jgi:tryptophanyl-tRNA synthetase
MTTTAITTATATTITTSPTPPPTRPRLLTGDRPTGPLHLGHYVGSLANRLRLQHDFDTFLIVADLHTLTTRNAREQITATAADARSIVLDQLACGIDPVQATFFLQSGVPEIAEIALLVQSLVTVPRLERVPSLKQMAQDAGKTELPFALLGYPVLQSADILCVKAHAVPVGPDNAAHVEVTREIARRFNHLYGEVFAVPEFVPAAGGTLPGTDGQSKMSKSLGNAIYLADDAETVRRKVAGMYTDPARTRADIPGRVLGNPVFALHDAFNPDTAQVSELKARYQAGRVGDVEVKTLLSEALNRFLDPIRERRAGYAGEPGLVEDLLADGTGKVRALARATVAEMRDAMGFGPVSPAGSLRASDSSMAVGRGRP